MVGGSPKSTTIASLQHEYALQFDDLPKNDLFRHIVDMDWNLSVFRSKNYKAEANRWIVKKNNDGEIEWRRLPIHQACICDPNTGIITCLLEAYPKGVYEVDNQERLPLHYACIHGADTYIIYLLLTAYPDSINQTDKWGKSPVDYAELSKHGNKEELIKVLRKGPSGYEFSASDKVKLEASITNFQKRLDEAKNTTSDADKYSQNLDESIEVNLEDSDDDEDPVSGELLMSRSIIRGLEEQLEASLTSNAEATKQAKEFREKNLMLEKNIKELEKAKKEVESYVGFEDERNRDVINALEKEVNTLSTRNTNMKFAFDRMEAAVLSLERNNKKKDATIAQMKEKIDEFVTFEKQLEKESVENLQAEITRLREVNRNFQEKINDLEQNDKETQKRLENVDRISQLSRKGYEAERERSTILEEEIESLRNEKIVNMEKIRNAESYQEDITILVEELKHTRSKIAEETEAKFVLHECIRDHEKYQNQAEKRMDCLEDKLCAMSDRNDELLKTIELLKSSLQGENSRFRDITRILDSASEFEYRS